MQKLVVFVVCLLHVALVFAAPQFITFKDGNVGVNFAGFTADAGLGGLLTGNAAHGGLSASAGTPFGQRAAAGLGGSLDGRAAGVAYANAQAVPSVAAGAAIGGRTGGSPPQDTGLPSVRKDGLLFSNTIERLPDDWTPQSATSAPVQLNVVQKIRPPPKHSLIKDTEPTLKATAVDANVAHAKHVVNVAPPPVPILPLQDNAKTDVTSNIHYQSGGVINNVLDIPIGILRSLQQSLGGLQVNKSVSVKTST